MASRRTTLVSVSALLTLGALGAVIFAIARQGDGNQELAQAPLNIETQITPAFIMAVDDSGSMTFQLSLPAADGHACWGRVNDRSPYSFFTGTELRTTGVCDYSYAYTGPSIGTGYYGIPPVDTYGFARSPDLNPAYFDPATTYAPWLNSDGKPYGSTAGNPEGNASTIATRIDPRNVATINLASWIADENARSRFQTQQGMFFPGDTEYRLVNNANCGNLLGGSVWRTAPKAGVNINGSCAVYVKYWPATFYLKSDSVVHADGTAVAGYENIKPVEIANACGTGCSLWKYAIAATDTVALQNFANWYSFYGNRNRAMVAGMTRSMANINNMRVGYFTINGTYGDVAMRDMAVQSQRDSLYTSMLALPASGSTYNLPAVNHIGAQFKRTDRNAPIQLSCQKNAGMLFTDGFSNIASTAPAITGLGAPFDPTPANSMAAIASQYYFDAAGGVSPLRPDMAAGQVPVPDACDTLPVGSLERKRLDCQKNLHMNFYGITLGGRGDIFDQEVEQDPFITNPAWPGYASGTRSTVDDIWHATVNTRGDFISAKTPSDITEAMRKVLASVGAGRTPSGSIALTGSRIGSNSLSVVPLYESRNNGTDWYSTLTGQVITSNPVTGAVTYTRAWEVTEQLPLPATRRIKVAKTAAAGVVPSVADFNTTNVTLANLCSNTVLSRCTAATIAALGVNQAQSIAYLRGDQSLEVDGVLRARTKVLGDIVNSSPVISAPTDDYGYRSLRGPDTGGGLPTYNPFNYDTYLATKKTRLPTVFAGANDGMLHAFNGANGVEQFAYIPATALGHMGNLLTPYSATAAADQRFQHRYYVDGPITVSDFYAGGAWKTALVGTAGAGGRGVFALNVSNPSAFGNTSALWEINDQVSDTTLKNNIGYVLGKPLIVPVKVGTAVAWKAIFGNGYGSVNGKAALFVVDLATGVTATVLADEELATLPLKNGMGNILALDRYVGSTTTKGSDGYADTVYGGDQNGAVWKFDLRTTTPAAQRIPFFIARDAANNRQAITGGFAAASGPGGGVMLYFGTGSFSFKADGTDTSIQSLYGIQDRETAGFTVAGRSVLQLQKVLVDTDGNRTVTSDILAAGKLGWYLDLGVSGSGSTAAATGERSVGNPAIEGGIVFFPTYQPTTGGCNATGANRIYGLSALSGAAALAHVSIGSPGAGGAGSGTGALALATGGTAPVKDVAVMTNPRVPPLSPTATAAEQAAALGARCSMIVQVAGAPPMYLPRPCGRQSWRQVR